MNEKIQEYAKRLKLSWTREHYKDIQEQDPEAFLYALLKQEVNHREERKLNLLLKQAQLPKTGNQPYEWQQVQIPQGITREALYEGHFIQEKENLILYGGVGAGKTYLSSLISLNAIHRYGSKIKFYTVASLVNQLVEANQNGGLARLMKQLEKLDLLILDELGYIPLSKEGAELLFQVISMCYQNKSIIITTNLQFGQWNHVFGNPILTEAVIDRLIHHSHLVMFTGDSYRYKESTLRNK